MVQIQIGTKEASGSAIYYWLPTTTREYALRPTSKTRPGALAIPLSLSIAPLLSGLEVARGHAGVGVGTRHRGVPASLSPALARSLRVSWNLVESDF